MAVGALGLVLDHLFDRAEQLVEEAKNAGLLLEMEAGAQLRRTIENAKVAYADSLNLTMDRVDATVRNTIDGIRNLVEATQERNAKNLRDIAKRAQQLANTLPFHNDRPQLTSVVPRYAVFNKKQLSIPFKFEGNFEHANKRGYAPSLWFNNKSYKAVHLTTQELEFRLPTATLFPHEVKELTYKEGVLKIPYLLKDGTKTLAQFKITVGALPASVGKITLKHKTKKSVTKERTKTCPEQYLSSTREAGNRNHLDHLFKATSSKGWHVKQGSSSVQTSHWGECSLPTFVSDDDDVVVYKGSTIHKSLGSSGRMHVSISFKEYKKVHKKKRHVKVLNLKWGETKAFSYPLNTWKVVYKAFDGSKKEFVGSDITTSPYLKIENQGGGFVIKVTKPSELI